MINNNYVLYSRPTLSRICVWIVFLTLPPGSIFAQYSSNSLYSLYGIGDLVPNSFAKQSGLGRAGVALKSVGFINAMNPASLTEYGANTVVFDMGVSGYYSTYESRGQKESALDGNIDHFAMAFPITGWLGTSIGFSPFSSIGYDISTTALFEGSTTGIETEFKGSGGINQFFIANSIHPLNGLSLGINLAYLMGSLDQTEISRLSDLGSTDVHTSNSYYLRNLYVGFGLQLDMPIGNDHLYAGITYHPRQKLVVNYTHEIVMQGEEETTLVSETESAQSFFIPGDLRAGFAYDINSKFRILGDYEIQKWTGNASLIDVISFTEKQSINAGIEFVLNPANPSNFFQKVEYRLGAYHESSYLLIRENQIEDRGITAGFGIPLNNPFSKINLSLEYGILGTLSKGLVRERYFGFSIDFAFSDTWFVKRKFQ